MLRTPEQADMVKQLMREYPKLDALQCETLVWAYYENKLCAPTNKGDNDHEQQVDLHVDTQPRGRTESHEDSSTNP